MPSGDFAEIVLTYLLEWALIELEAKAEQCKHEPKRYVAFLLLKTDK